MMLKVLLVVLGALLVLVAAAVVFYRSVTAKDRFICPRCSRSRSEFEAHVVHTRKDDKESVVRVCTSCLGAENERLIALNDEAKKIAKEHGKR